MAVLGELGRYPLLTSALKHCIKYEWVLRSADTDSVVSKAIREMTDKPHLDTWYSRVQKIKSVLNVPNLKGCKDTVSIQLSKKLNSSFDRFWIDQINIEKIGSDGIDHNKLRFYKTLKGSFTQEPYILNILNKYGLPDTCKCGAKPGIGMWGIYQTCYPYCL